jgi:phosphoribosylglycinamide formyltransferase-1
VRLGVLGSSGGGVFAAVDALFASTRPGRIGWAVACDRPCGLERYARDRGHAVTRVGGTNAERSAAASAFFVEQRVDAVLLFYVRLVTAELFDRLPTVNFHPAVLPAYPGLHALERAHADGATEFGATAHAVDASMDGGPVIAQVRAAMPDVDLETLSHVSYVQKTYLALLVCDALARGTLVVRTGGRAPAWAGPPELAGDLAAAFAAFAERESVPIAFATPCLA